MTTPLQNLCHFYEHLSLQSLAQIDQIYAPDAQFKDPFNEVQNLASIKAIFAHMFVATHHPRFKILQTVQEGHTVCLIWDFYFEKKGFANPVCIHGTSLIAFNAQGLVVKHRDYWDSGAELYAKLPWVGRFFTWLARQFTTPSLHPQSRTA
ncbi:MAG: nuclear transport factor 2 family protein [Cytophagales bacterium]|nr:nuclear transport factor 2 family protein [Cytophagales bacterium]